MRLGFDIDGCLANFRYSYEKLIVEVTGKDLFPKDKEYGTVWDYPEEICGYSKSEIKGVWKHHITKSDRFWLEIPPLPLAVETIQVLNHLALSGEHEIYFITDRFGVMPKLQTEVWLAQLGMACPTVLLTGEKDDAMRILKLDAYVDDKLSHCNHCMAMVRQAGTPARVYMIDAPYNQGAEMDPTNMTEGDLTPAETLRTKRDPGVKVVSCVAEMLVAEGVWPVMEEGESGSVTEASGGSGTEVVELRGEAAN